MAEAFIVTGTDTDLGKTVFCAMLTLALDGCYWKPIQSGTEGGTDSERARRMSGLPEERFLPERHVFRRPLSPHRAAELEGVEIDESGLVSLPFCERPLVVEGAGGLLVPVTRTRLQIDLFKRWKAPVILCARTALGTINHTLLSVEALRRRGVPVAGIAFIGDANPDTERTILSFSGLRGLGRLPFLQAVNPRTLKAAFAEHFRYEDFLPARAASR